MLTQFLELLDEHPVAHGDHGGDAPPPYQIQAPHEERGEQVGLALFVVLLDVLGVANLGGALVGGVADDDVVVVGLEELEEADAGGQLAAAQAKAEVVGGGDLGEEVFELVEQRVGVAVDGARVVVGVGLVVEGELEAVVLVDGFEDGGLDLEEGAEVVGAFEGLDDASGQLRRNGALRVHLLAQLDEGGVVLGQGAQAQVGGDEVEPGGQRVGGEGLDLEPEGRGGDLDGAGVDVEAVQVVLDHPARDLGVGPVEAAVLGLLAVEGDQQVEGLDEEVAAAAGGVQQLEVTDGVGGVGDGVGEEGLGHPVGPVALLLRLQRHQRVLLHLARLALGAPGLAALVEAVEGAVLLAVRGPAVLVADGEPGLTEAVVQEPLHHVPLREHLRLRSQLVGLDLAAGVELGVEGFAVGVVPILVDPPQRCVVLPRALQRLVVQRLHHGPQRGGGQREQGDEAHLAEQAGQLKGQLLAQQPQQQPVPLRRVVGGLLVEQGTGEVGELLVGGAGPAPGEQGGLDGGGGFEVLDDDEPVEERGGDLGDGRVQVALTGLGAERGVGLGLGGLGVQLVVEPGVEAGAAVAVGLGELGLGGGEGQLVGRRGGGGQLTDEALAQVADGRVELAAGGGGHRHGVGAPSGRWVVLGSYGVDYTIRVWWGKGGGGVVASGGFCLTRVMGLRRLAACDGFRAIWEAADRHG